MYRAGGARTILMCVCCHLATTGWTDFVIGPCLSRDTAGQERYASLAPLYYRGASAAAVVYDITNEDTFAKAKHWVSELQKNAGGNLGTRVFDADLRKGVRQDCSVVTCNS